jgi:predicted Zn-dependent protease
MTIDDTARATVRGIDHDQVRAALDIFGPGCRLDIAAERIGLMRYSRSKVTAQHSERRLRVRVRLARSGRIALGTLETLEPDTVRALAARLDEAIGGQRPGTTTTPVTHPPSTSPEPSESVLRADAADRYRWFATVRDGLEHPAHLGGSIRHEAVERVVADSDGLFRSETLTKALMLAIAQKENQSASVRLLNRDGARIDVDGVADRLRADLPALPVCEPVTKSCRVVLRPQAAIALLSTYGYAALGAAGYAAGSTAVAGKLGETVTSPLVSLVDDGTDADGMPSGFDPEGSPKRRTPLIDAGVLVGVVSDLANADVTGGTSTGHAVPAAWRFGVDPSPSHLLLAPGDATEADMIAGCDDGLVITRLDYLRILHAKDTLVTGTTRDATYRVRDGRVVALHPQVRLTFRMDEVLRAVLAVGRDRDRGENVFMESVVAPALLIDAGPLLG